MSPRNSSNATVPKSGAVTQRDLARQVLPTLGPRPIAPIRRKDIVKLLDEIEDSAGSAQADTVLAIVRRIMNWHTSATRASGAPL
jgi:hypothetical protein